MDLDKAYYDWKIATSELKWGVQKAFKSVLQAAADGQTTLNYNTDYGNNGACLVNTVGVMLTTGGGHGVPMANFASVVSLFDQINRALADVGVNIEHNVVSPLAADILLQNFAPEKEAPVGEKPNVVEILTPVGSTGTEELSDDEFDKELRALFVNGYPMEIQISEPSDSQ